MSTEFELAQPPSDGVTAVHFAAQSEFLIASSWDKCLHVYDVAQNVRAACIETPAALLDCCFSDDLHAFYGGLEKKLRVADLTTRTDTVVGSHDEAIRCVDYVQSTQNIVTGSWDKTVRMWDPRSSSMASSTTVNERVYSLSSVQYTLLVATAARTVSIFDVRRMDEPLETRESILNYPTRVVRAFPNGAGYAMGSVEGRVAIEYLDPAPEVQARRYAFKCHRRTVQQVDTAYPVNAIAFHREYGTFATGGGDGVVNLWDGESRKRLAAPMQYPTSIAALCFNATGLLLAIASSYTFEEGEKAHPPDAIFIKAVVPSDVQPRPRAA